MDVANEGGRPLISIFRGQAFAFPVEIRMMERHPLGSQAFVPLQPVPFLIVVAPDRDMSGASNSLTLRSCCLFTVLTPNPIALLLMRCSIMAAMAVL